MAKSAVDIAVQVAALSGQERLLLIAPGTHSKQWFPELLRTFSAHPCVALEVDNECLQRLRNQSEAATHSNHQAVLGRATRLPFKKHSFDIIFSFQSLYSIRPHWTVLAEFHRVLVPAGKLILFEPTRHGLLSALRDKLSGPGKRIFSIDEIKYRVARSDYQIDHIVEEIQVDRFPWPAYCVSAIKVENPAEPVPQFMTTKEMLERRKNKFPTGEQLP